MSASAYESIGAIPDITQVGRLIERTSFLGAVHRSVAVYQRLLAQHGVGPETANSILLYAGSHPVFVVDAYTERIGTRIGLFRTDEYRAIQGYFEQRIPRDLATYQEYHALLVRHAKTLCRRTNPMCAGCPIQSLCDFGRRRKR